ncbi:MAG: tryptophan synthase subunit alpha [Luteitalea sp.]|nr:tryptophan synthase subunit alpha [Luteitalea sp.]
MRSAPPRGLAAPEQRDGGQRCGLVAFVTAGDPDRARAGRILRAVDAGGADVIEVGVPFSDPLADGPIIQRASERALAAGMTLAATLDVIAEERRAVRAPIVLFTYANPLVRMGLTRFATRAAEAGVDGVLLVDVPLEEAAPFHDVLCAAGLDPICLVSPTTSDDRLRRSARSGRGFLYAISRFGVTGVRDQIAREAQALVRRIREQTTMPVAVGFGLSRPEHVSQVSRWADAAVVGSALVAEVAKHADSPALEARVTAFVRWLRNGNEPTA